MHFGPSAAIKLETFCPEGVTSVAIPQKKPFTFTGPLTPFNARSFEKEKKNYLPITVGEKTGN